jgi:hypothetical protein
MANKLLFNRHPCNELGLQGILYDFQVASDKFDLEGATFSQVCNPNEMLVDLKPVNTAED